MQYFSDLHAALRKTEATNLEGAKLKFDEAMEQTHDVVAALKENGGHIIFIGNGGSAAIASHMATDWLKNGKFKATCYNDPAMLTCITNDLGYENVFSLPLSYFGRPYDMLVAISSSGKSANILKAVETARELNMSILTLSGFGRDNPLRQVGDMNLWIPSDSYGFVEIGHLAICHALLDRTMAE
jgi:D-sedoheptulose 7-phosphate isomerase